MIKSQWPMTHLRPKAVMVGGPENGQIPMANDRAVRRVLAIAGYFDCLLNVGRERTVAPGEAGAAVFNVSFTEFSSGTALALEKDPASRENHSFTMRVQPGSVGKFKAD